MGLQKSNIKICFIKIDAEENISDIPVTNGYIILCKDTGNLYMDHDNARIKALNSYTESIGTLATKVQITELQNYIDSITSLQQNNFTVNSNNELCMKIVT